MIENNLQKTEVTNNINMPSLSREAEGFLCRIAAPALIAGSEFLATKFRAATFNTICELSNKYAEQIGVDIKPTPPKFLLPFIEKASLEDDEDLQKAWAKLLVAAGSEYNSIHIQYSEILSQISGKEARLLKEIYENQKKNGGLNSIVKYDKAVADVDHGRALRASLKTIDSKLGRLGQNSFSKNNSIKLNLASAFGLSPSLRYEFPYIKDGEEEHFDSGSFTDHPMDSFIKSNHIFISLVLLQKLDLLKYDYNCESLRNGWFKPQWGLTLTPFGYKFIETLEDTVDDQNID